MDGDSTTINHIRKEVDAFLGKRTDENHLKKGIIGSLFTLSAKHNILKNRSVRGHIVR